MSIQIKPNKIKMAKKRKNFNHVSLRFLILTDYSDSVLVDVDFYEFFHILYLLTFLCFYGINLPCRLN